MKAALWRAAGLGERSHQEGGRHERPPRWQAWCCLWPSCLIVIAVLAGLVFGGVVQGHADRVGRAASSTTDSRLSS